MEKEKEPRLQDLDMGEGSLEESLSEGKGPSRSKQGPKTVPVKPNANSRPAVSRDAD